MIGLCVAVLTAGIPTGIPAAPASGMLVVADEHGARSVQAGPGKDSTNGSNGSGESRLEPTAATQSVPKSLQDQRVEELSLRRAAGLRQLETAVAQEEVLMRNLVQTMDRGTAEMWLAGFICAKPWGCLPQNRDKWIEAILFAVERNDLPICKEILGLVASIISIESGFRADPPAVDPSRGETVTSLMDRAEKELHEKFGKIMAIPPVPQLYLVYKNKYYPRLAACKTEGEIESVARNIAAELKKDAENLPSFVRALIYKEIDKVANVVRTKGSMQLNFSRAKQVMSERGEQFTEQELSDYMYTVHGGVDVGVAALKAMFVQYAARFGTPGNLSWLFLVGMDYNYGPFSSRNMMEQIRIRDLSGRKVALDGDFLHYDDKARPSPRESETLLATAAIFPKTAKSDILDALVLEKDPQYIYTELHETIAEAHRHKFGETPFAVIGDLWMGQNAQIKHGMTWKTRSYLRKLDRYLNAIPWDQE